MFSYPTIWLNGDIGSFTEVSDVRSAPDEAQLPRGWRCGGRRGWHAGCPILPSCCLPAPLIERVPGVDDGAPHSGHLTEVNRIKVPELRPFGEHQHDLRARGCFPRRRGVPELRAQPAGVVHRDWVVYGDTSARAVQYLRDIERRRVTHIIGSRLECCAKHAHLLPGGRATG
jgi:hypothetical protein